MSFKNISHHQPYKQRHGPSSYWMHKPETVFAALQLKTGDYFLDLGCGPGDYVFQASRIVGDSGLVYALDICQQMIADCIDRIASERMTNIKTVVCDITGPIPVEDRCIDVCLIATVLHMPGVARGEQALFTEIGRVLKAGGRLAIIECKREDVPFGPPGSMRLTPEGLETSMAKYGFEKMSYTDLGSNYMLVFVVSPNLPSA